MIRFARNTKAVENEAAPADKAKNSEKSSERPAKAADKTKQNKTAADSSDSSDKLL